MESPKKIAASLPPALQEELASTLLTHFVDYSRSSNNNIVISVFENENRHLFYGWGSNLGIHLFPPFDRFPYTDSTGTYKQSSLSSVRPLPGFDWVGEWNVWHPLDGNCDDDGYEYATVWLHLGNDKTQTYNAEGPLTRHRRRQWTRIMTRITISEQIDSSRLLVSSTYNPYVLHIRIIRSCVKDIKIIGLLKSAYVQVVSGDIQFGRTVSVAFSRNLEFNETFSMGFRRIDRTLPIKVQLWIERALFSKPLLLGMTTIQPDYLWSNRNKSLLTSIAASTDKGRATTDIEITLAFKELFAVKPIVSLSKASTINRSTVVVRQSAFDSSLCKGALVGRFRYFNNILSDCEASDHIASSLLSASASSLLSSSDILDILSDLQALDRIGASFSSVLPLRSSHDKLRYSVQLGMQYSDFLPFYNHSAVGTKHHRENKELFEEMSRDIKFANDKLLNQRLHFGTFSTEDSFAHSPICSNEFDLIVATDIGEKYVLRFTRLIDYVQVISTLIFMTRGRDVSYCCEAMVGAIEVDGVAGTSDLAGGLQVEGKSFRLSSGLQALNTRNIVRNGRSEVVNWRPIRLSVNDEHDFVISWINSKFDLTTLNLTSILYVELLHCSIMPFSHVVAISSASIDLHRDYSFGSSNFPNSSSQNLKIPVSVTLASPNRQRIVISPDELVIQRSDERSVDWLRAKLGKIVHLYLPSPDALKLLTSENQLALQVLVGLSVDPSGDTAQQGRPPGVGSEPRLHGADRVVEAILPLGASDSEISNFELSTKVVPLRERVEFTVKLRINSIQRVLGADRGATADIYFKVYLIDALGNIVRMSNPDTADTTRATPRPTDPAPNRRYTVSKIAGILTSTTAGKSALVSVDGEIFRSQVCSASLHPSWQEQVLITKENGLLTATDVLIEFWEANILRQDVCIGECRVNLLTCSLFDNQDSSSLRSQEIRPSVRATKHVSRNLGTMYFFLDWCRSDCTESSARPLGYGCMFSGSNVVQKVTTQSHLFTGVIMLLDSSCVLPTFWVDLSFDGIYLLNLRPSSSPDLASLDADSISLLEILENCQERVTSDIESNDFNILIPWNQIELDRCTPIASSMLAVQVTIQRCFGGKSGKMKRASKSIGGNVYREIVAIILVGPCPASQMHDLISSRVSALDLRSQVAESLTQEDIERTAKVLLADVQKISAEMVEASNASSREQKDKGVATMKETQESASSDNSHFISNEKRIFRKMALQQFRLKCYFSLLMDRLASLKSKLIPSNRSRTSQISLERQVAIRFEQVMAKEGRSLLERLDDCIGALETDVMNAIIANQGSPKLPQIGPSNGVRPEEEFAQQLSILIHSYYLHITNYFSSIVDQGKFEMMSDPQSKHALLEALISKDDLIEILIGPYLNTCGLRFNRKPLLSYIIDFDILVGMFSQLLNVEVAEWDQKTINAFTVRSALKTGLGSGGEINSFSPFTNSNPRNGESVAVDGSSTESIDSFIPWEIEALEIRVGRMTRNIWISAIPENVRFQLQIQIGSKRVTPCSTLSSKQIGRIETINARVASAVVSSYMRLGTGYEDAIHRVNEHMRRIQFQRLGWKSDLHVDTCYTSSRISRLTMGADPDLSEAEQKGINEVEEKILQYLVACANDAYRIVSSHLPLCEKELYIENEEIPNDFQGKFLPVVSSRGGMVLFQNVDTLFKNISDFAINSLANMVFLDLSGYVLSKFDELWEQHAHNSGPFVLSQDMATNKLSSPVDIIIATLEEFLTIIGDTLELTQQMELLYICCRRFVLRYLLFIRDRLSEKLAQPQATNSAQHSIVIDSNAVLDGVSSALGFQSLAVKIIPHDTISHAASSLPLPVQSITSAVSQMAEGLGFQSEDGASSNSTAASRQRKRRLFDLSDEERYFLVRDFTAIQNLFTRMLARSPTPVNDRYIVFCLNNLNNTIRSLFNANADGDLLVETIEDLVPSILNGKMPEFSDDFHVYDASILQYLGISSMRTLRFQPTSSAFNYQIKVSDISCIHIKNVNWKIYVRFRIDEMVCCTNIKLVDEVLDWDDPLSFNVKMAEDKELVVEVMEKLPFRVLKDFPRAELRIPLTALLSSGGAPAGWYQLQSTMDRRAAWKNRSLSRGTLGHATTEREFLEDLPAFGRKVSVQFPKGTSGPRADMESAQIRLRFKVTRL